MPFLDALPRLTERAWAAQVDKLARMFGWGMWRDNATNAPRRCPRCKAEIHLPRNTPGWPDRVYVRGEDLLFVEFKTDRNYPTADQRGWLDALRQVKRVGVAVWKPRQVEEVMRTLR